MQKWKITHKLASIRKSIYKAQHAPLFTVLFSAFMYFHHIRITFESYLHLKIMAHDDDGDGGAVTSLSFLNRFNKRIGECGWLVDCFVRFSSFFHSSISAMNTFTQS